MVRHRIPRSNRIQFPRPDPGVVVEWINQFDTFLLTMAMAALGAETSFDKFKKAGAKPFLLAGILCVWLISGGYLLARYVTPLFN